MNRFIISFALLCFCVTVAYGQDCDSNLQRATELVSQKNYCEAEKYYQAYANCNAEADVSNEIALCERLCKTQDSQKESASFAQNKTDNADETDKIYYDKNWKGVSNPADAAFYRVVEYPTKVFSDYYITGELQTSGKFISIDKYDDSRSVFDGEATNYFKEGQVQEVKNFQNGKLNGDFCEYTEDGLVKQKGTYLDGKLDGLYTKFLDDGRCFQAEYSNGQPKYDYYVLSDTTGNIMQVHFSDNKPFWNSPDVSERKTDYQDGVAYQYYINYGVTVSQAVSKDNDYGKWFKVDIVIQNNTMEPIDFDPATGITAYSTDKNQRQTSLGVWSYERYMKRVHRTQVWEAVGTGLLAASAVYAATTATTPHNKYIHNNHTAPVHENRVGAPIHENRASVPAHGGNVTVRGNNVPFRGNRTPVRESYARSGFSENSYRNAPMHVSRQIVAYPLLLPQYTLAVYNSPWDISNAVQAGYLKRNTIYPGQSVAGYVLIQRNAGKTVNITLTINGANYEYAWNYGN